jgi:quercetin dioxygenase-like cupin family protein
MEYNLNNLPYKTLRPGFETETNTIAFFKIAGGAVLPTHNHVHTQTTTILSGTLEVTLNGVTNQYGANEVLHILSNEPHSVIALTECMVIDVFAPVREDYLHI